MAYVWYPFPLHCAPKKAVLVGPSQRMAQSHPTVFLCRPPPVICCRPFESNLTLKIAGFHYMSLPTTAAISRRVASPRVCNSLHEVAKICALSRGTQNSIVMVSNPRPRKNAKVVGGTSFRFVSNPKALMSLVNCASSSHALSLQREHSGHLSTPPQVSCSVHILGTMTHMSSTHNIIRTL